MSNASTAAMTRFTYLCPAGPSSVPRGAFVAGGGDRAMRAAAHALNAGDAHQPPDLVTADP
jgi:hypothetical protein